MFKIYKFGGSILKNAEDIKLIALIIKNENCIAVFSAFFGITDSLIMISKLTAGGFKEYEMQLESIENFHVNICKNLEIDYKFVVLIFANIKKFLDAVYQLRDLSPKILDTIMSYGEFLSSKIAYEYIAKDCKINYCDAKNVIKTDSNYGNAIVNIEKTSTLVEKFFENKKTYIMPGFIASDIENNPTTLGRNGSDYSAALVASILNAIEVTIWKDVDGVFTANPKLVSKAIQLEKISYREMAELSYFGNKVISLQALQPAVKKNVKIYIRNLYNIKNKGTLISTETDERYKIKGISKVNDIVLVSVSGLGMVGISGFSKRVFSSLSSVGVSVIFIAQSTSEISICFAIKKEQLEKVKIAIAEEFVLEIKENHLNISIKENQTIIAIAGAMTNTPGISAKVFGNLAKANINVVAIAQDFSEMNISISLDSNVADLAIRLIHNSIFEKKQINCLIAGKGVIGSGVVKMLKLQHEYLINNGINIDIIGVCDSKKYYYNEQEFVYKNYDEVIKKFKENAHINYVLIDCTSSDILVKEYQSFIEQGFNIVTPNKKANTMDYNEFSALKECFKKNKKYFFYEANVGAGLPIISTIKDLLNCGDEIIKIEGVFSGTLSYIFNTLSSNKKFSEIVLDAKERGFTEPDPRDDLSGSDVGRKLLILSRMLGYKINLSDIKIQNLVNLSDDEIFKMTEEAKNKNSVLRYIGTIINGKCFANIQTIPNTNPLSSTQYTDNIISITTKYYNNTPLVIRGPGAGADVTSIGIVSDLIKLSNLM
jgi:aspartokinase/homoserine dehydrogenase 1